MNWSTNPLLSVVDVPDSNSKPVKTKFYHNSPPFKQPLLDIQIQFIRNVFGRLKYTQKPMKSVSQFIPVDNWFESNWCRQLKQHV